jgi:hypothetical protein
MIGITWFGVESNVGWCTIGLSPRGERHRGERRGMMDIEQVTRKAISNVFDHLIEEGYSPSMEFEGNSLTIWTEDASAEFVAIINRKRTGFGEHVLSIQAVQGEGESYLAEMIADEFVEIIRGSDE